MDTKRIKISPLTLLLGKNNSGKSSILKALSFFKTGIAQGKESHLSLAPAPGLRMGGTLVDLFHKRELVGLGFEAEFSGDIDYEIRFLANQGDIHPYKMKLKKGDQEELVLEGNDLSNRIAGFFPVEYPDEIRDDFYFEVFHIGPLRVVAPGILAVSSAINKKFVGYNGEDTYGILLYSYLKDNTLFNKVSGWMEANMDGISLRFEPIDAAGSNYVLNVIRDNVAVNIADVGLGLSQILPIITQSYIENRDTIVAIEQPVLHLHPSAHEAVAIRLADAAVSTGTRYIIESHSKNFLLALRLATLLPETGIKKEDISIYFIDGETMPSGIREIEINKDGSLSYWPTGVFGEDAELMDKIMESR